MVPSSSSIAVRAGCRQRVQDRVQLGTDSVGESACEMPHAVAALLQLHIPPVLLQSIIDRFWAVGVGSSDHSLGKAAQLRRRQDGGVFGEQLLGGFDCVRVEVGPGEFVHGPFHNLHFLRGDESVALQRGQLRQPRLQLLANHGGPRPDRGGGADPGGGVAGGELQHSDQELVEGGGAVFLRQVVGFGVGDQVVVDQR